MVAAKAQKKQEQDDLADQPKLFDVGVTIPIEEEEELPEPPKPAPVDQTAPMPFTPLHGARLSADRIFRYNLWRRVREKGKTLLFVGLNPSVADEDTDDPTIHRMVDFGTRWGYALIIVTNLFAFRATDPKQMKKQLDPIGAENDAWIAKARKTADCCVVAWGNGGKHRKRSADVMNLLNPLGPVHCLGITKSGQPKHPLYLKKNLEPIPYLGIPAELITFGGK